LPAPRLSARWSGQPSGSVLTLLYYTKASCIYMRGHARGSAGIVPAPVRRGVRAADEPPCSVEALLQNRSSVIVITAFRLPKHSYSVHRAAVQSHTRSVQTQLPAPSGNFSLVR